MTVGDARPRPVPDDRAAAAAADGRASGPGDAGRIGRHVQRAARRGRPRHARRLRRREGLRPGEAGTGDAGGRVDAPAGRPTGGGERHASGMGRHARDPRRPAALQPRAGPAPADAARGCRYGVWLGAAPEAAAIRGRFLLHRRPRATSTRCRGRGGPDEDLEAERALALVRRGHRRAADLERSATLSGHGTAAGTRPHRDLVRPGGARRRAAGPRTDGGDRRRHRRLQRRLPPGARSASATCWCWSDRRWRRARRGTRRAWSCAAAPRTC